MFLTYNGLYIETPSEATEKSLQNQIAETSGVPEGATDEGFEGSEAPVDEEIQICIQNKPSSRTKSAVMSQES